MIYCPQCGTANKPNSKFRKNYGAPLVPSTDVRCPICGTLNPPDAVKCRNCGTHLTPTGASGTSPTEMTPADAPETITPFNPPEVPPETEDPLEKSVASSSFSHRPSFSRANSEWLRRINRTPPAEPPPIVSTPVETTPPQAQVETTVAAPALEVAPSAAPETPPVTEPASSTTSLTNEPVETVAPEVIATPAPLASSDESREMTQAVTVPATPPIASIKEDTKAET